MRLYKSKLVKYTFAGIRSVWWQGKSRRPLAGAPPPRSYSIIVDDDPGSANGSVAVLGAHDDVYLLPFGEFTKLYKIAPRTLSAWVRPHCVRAAPIAAESGYIVAYSIAPGSASGEGAVVTRDVFESRYASAKGPEACGAGTDSAEGGRG